MKIEDVKHNHKLTDLLKVGLFACLMFAPIASVAIRSAYVVVNKNAYQSYSEVVETTTTQLNDGDSFNNGMLYTFTWNGLTTGATSNRIYVLNGNTNLVDTYFSGETWTVDYFNPSYEGVRTRLIVYDTNGTQHNAFNWQDTSNQFWAYTKDTSNVLATNSMFNVYSNTYITSKLDNVFEYSVSQLEQSQLFGWTQNTAVFTGVQTMTNNLGINSLAIPILLTYWFLLTVIYVIVDIVLKLFTVLTHMIGKKTT